MASKIECWVKQPLQLTHSSKTEIKSDKCNSSISALRTYRPLSFGEHIEVITLATLTSWKGYDQAN